jgi:hypothetical protein
MHQQRLWRPLKYGEFPPILGNLPQCMQTPDLTNNIKLMILKINISLNTWHSNCSPHFIATNKIYDFVDKVRPSGK